MATSPIVQAFRDGLSQGALLIQKCHGCGRTILYPRYACPHCQSDDLGWQKAAGTGTLMSVTVLRAGAPEGFEQEIPYGLGVIRLDEGVQLLGRLVPDADGEWNGYACDMPVAYTPAIDKPYAMFGRIT